MSLGNHLERIIINSHDVEALKSVYIYATMISSSYLKRLSNNGDLNISYTGFNLDELSKSCISDIFKRNDKNELIEFKSYKPFNLPFNKDEKLLIIEFKRFVTCKVKDSLFNIFKLNDPELGRLIRNLKKHLKSNPEISKSGKLYCFSKSQDCSLPIIPHDIIEIYLVRIMKSQPTVPTLINDLIQLAKKNNKNRIEFKVTELALLIRLASMKYYRSIECSNSTSISVADIDYSQFIQKNISQLKASLQEKYVGSGKVTIEYYNAYFSTVEKFFLDSLKYGNNKRNSLVDYFSEILPNVHVNTYMNEHRAVVEYLVRKTRNKLQDELKNDLYFSA